MTAKAIQLMSQKQKYWECDICKRSVDWGVCGIQVVKPTERLVALWGTTFVKPCNEQDIGVDPDAMPAAPESLITSGALTEEPLKVAEPKISPNW